MDVEATILSDILSIRAEENPPLYVFWSVLTGVLLSRGDWDAAVEILSNMESLGIESNTKNKKLKHEVNNNVKNKYYSGNSKSKISRRPYSGSEISQTVELAVLYSLAGGLPLLTMSGEKALVAMDLKRLLSDDSDDITSLENKNTVQANGNESATKKTKLSNSLHSISESLNRIPAELSLDSSEKRTVCTLGDIIGFLERCRGDERNEMKSGDRDNDDFRLTQDGIKSLSSFEDYDDVSDTYDTYSTYVQRRKYSSRKVRIPVGIALLQSLFAAAINERKFKQAARIIRLLEGSRLVIDLDPPALAAVSSESVTARQSINTPTAQTMTQPINPSESISSQSLIDDSRSSVNVNATSNMVTNIPNETSAVKLVRETLARRWAAMLIASSLNKLKSNVAGSLKMMAALKYLQGDEK